MAVVQRNWRPLALIALACLVPVAFANVTYLLYTACLIICYIIATMGLSLLIGVGGQISLGHAGFMAVGAYASALLSVRLHLPVWLAILGAALISAAVGFLMGLPALRLHGPYLALATISFGAALPEVFLQWESVTGGHHGISPPRPEFFGIALDTEFSLFYFMLAVLVLLCYIANNVLKSRFGRSFLVLRESEIAAQALGINLAVAKTTVFAISAAYAGVAGALMAHLVGFISPYDFDLFISGQLLAMAVMGGLGTPISGGILGAAAIQTLLELLKKFRGISLIAEGFAILLVVWFAPGGLTGLLLGAGARLRGGRRQGAPPKARASA